MQPPPRPPTRQPWSMKWIIVAIVVFVVGYTLVNFFFRKPGPGYRPYQDAQDRATVARLLAAGWRKLPVDLRRPTEKPPLLVGPATIGKGAPGLGLNFDANFAEKPKLLSTIDRVQAPSEVSRGDDYVVYFTASLRDLKTQLGEVALYHKAQELVLVPGLEKLPGNELRSRWNDANYTISFATDDLAPGTYQIRIVAEGPAATWSFRVR